MKPVELLTHRVTFRSGIIVVAAAMVLALSSTAARRVGLAVLAATGIRVSSAPVIAAEHNGTAIRPFRVKVPEADVADLRRRLAATRWPDKETVTGITVFPDEVLRAQETWARRAFPKLTYFNEVNRGGHFAMWEYPELFAAELRAAFRSSR
jgi:pimeloyl-ACP methyl ester carboxylesterase